MRVIAERAMKWSPPLWLGMLIIGFIAGFVLDQKLRQPDDQWPRDGELLSIVRKGEHLDNNRFLPGISGNVTAAQDLALVLLNGRTMIRPLALFSGECVSGRDKADLFTEMGDAHPPWCEAMIAIGHWLSSASVASISNVFIYGDNRGAVFTVDGNSAWAIMNSTLSEPRK